MKEWKKPELFDLSIQRTEASYGTSGNDQWIPDCIEQFIEGYTGDVFGPKS